MIHLLIVEREGPREPAGPPSFEILRAHSAGEAVETLSRNRRIDAVLFFEEALARETAERIREEDPAAPPLFLAGTGEAAGVIPLGPGETFSSLARLLGED